jgi:RNA polymerase sigma factor (sigma-70 family)
MIRRAFRGAFGDEEIEDIYANAWLGTLRALERKHDRLSDEEVRRYVLTAVANHASKELRRRSRRPTAPLESVHTVPDHDLLPDEVAAKLEDSRITRDVLASLPPRRRAVILLRYGWGLDPRHVCGLVKGLSPRAYRKEITRGVDELTSKLRMVERGEWCADREPVLKAYAAGLADPEQQRQAQQHLSHCRRCADFVAKLSGQLHDLGASAAASGAVDAIGDDRIWLADRVGDLIHRVRDPAGGAVGGHTGGVEEMASQAAAVPTSARGAGAAGAGVLAKFAGLGAAGKLAAACVGGGAAATVCLAAGIGPAQLPGLGSGSNGDAHNAAVERPVQSEPPRSANVPIEPADEAPPPPAPAPSGSTPDDQTSESPVAEPPPPIEPSAPPAQQEFGVGAAASADPVAPATSSHDRGGGGAVQQEFGP